MAAGTTADAIERRLGRRNTGILATALVVAGAVAVMVGGTLPVTLAGAFTVGFGAGAMLAPLNLVLASPGGALAETRFARANAWALLAAMLAPLLIAAMAASALGWHAVLLVPIGAAIALQVAGGLPSAGRRAVADGVAVAAAGVLDRLAVRRLGGVDRVRVRRLGLVGGRGANGRVAGDGDGARDRVPRRHARRADRVERGPHRQRADGATGPTPRWSIAAAGGVVVWLATTPVASAVGLFVAGIGTASLYPLGMATALERAGDAALAAGARLTLATGVAILTMPLLLGAVADNVGVVAGWPLVIGLCALAFVLLRVPAGPVAQRA